MDIKIEKEGLLGIIGLVQNLITQRATLPVLSNYLVEADLGSGKVWITSTNLEIGIKSCLPAKVLEEGAITLPAKKLGEIAHNMPANGSSVDVQLKLLENGRVQVSGAKSRFQLAGIPKEDYPVLPEFQNKNTLKIPSKNLVNMIERTIHAVSNDETRYVLNGVLFLVSGGVGFMVATDGRRLACVEQLGFPAESAFKIIVPAKALSEVVKITLHYDNNLEGEVFIDVAENQIGFRIGETVIFSRLIDGNFPNWEQVVPKKSDFRLLANTDVFLAATKRAALCIAERAGTCKYKFFKDRCQITSRTSGQYEFDEDVSIVEYSGEEGFEVSFNPAYVVDFLKTVKTDVFEFSFTTSVNPALLRPINDARYSYVVMPMRVQSS